MNNWLVTVEHEDGTKSTSLIQTQSGDDETRESVAKDFTEDGVKKYRNITVVAADPNNLPPVHHSTDDK